MRRGSLAVVYALITIVLWGTVTAVSKLMLRSLSNIQLIFYVALFSTISLFALAIFTKKLSNILEIIKEHKVRIIILGMLGLGLYPLFFITALTIAPAAQVNVLNYLWPIFILVFSLFVLQEKFSWKTLVAFVLGLIGTYVIITQGSLLSIKLEYLSGYVLALGAAISWAIFSVFNKKKKLDSIASLFLFNVVGLILIALLMFFTKSSFLILSKEVFGTFYIGLFATAIAHLLWIKSLRIGKTSLIANLGHLTPFISLFFIFIILKERILVSEIVGLAIIVSGILLQRTKST